MSTSLAPTSDMSSPLEGAPNLLGERGAMTAIRCGRCIHFGSLPKYAVSGVPTVCGSARIGRLSNQAPCVNFSPDSTSFTKLPKPVQTQMEKLLDTVEASIIHGNRIDDAFLTMVTWLAVARVAKKKGLRLNAPVYITDSDVLEGKPGKLLHIGPKLAVVLRHDGVRVIIDAKALRVTPDGKKPVEDSGEIEVGEIAGKAKPAPAEKGKRGRKPAAEATAAKPTKATSKKATPKAKATKAATKKKPAVKKAVVKAKAKKTAKK